MDRVIARAGTEERRRTSRVVRVRGVGILVRESLILVGRDWDSVVVRDLHRIMPDLPPPLRQVVGVIRREAPRGSERRDPRRPEVGPRRPMRRDVGGSAPAIPRNLKVRLVVALVYEFEQRR